MGFVGFGFEGHRHEIVYDGFIAPKCYLGCFFSRLSVEIAINFCPEMNVHIIENLCPKGF